MGRVGRDRTDGAEIDRLGFHGCPRNRYTTLAETDDRIGLIEGTVRRDDETGTNPGLAWYSLPEF